MKYIVIKQTIEFTSGIYKGKQEERYIRVYSEKEKQQLLKSVPVFGSPAKLIKAVIL